MTERTPLHQTVGTSTGKTARTGRAISLLASTVIQSSAITTLIVVPLFLTATMPEPASRLGLPKFVPANVATATATVPDTPSAATTRSAELRRASISLRPLPQVMTPPVGWDSLEKSSTDIGDLFEDFGTSSLGLFGGPGTPGTGVAGRGGALEHTPEPESEPNPVPVVIGGDVRRPRKIVHVDPVYPPIALAARIQGVVALRAVLDAEGNVVNLSVVESEPLLDNAARDAVRQWKYEPTVLNGKRVAVVMDVRVAFRLN